MQHLHGVIAKRHAKRRSATPKKLHQQAAMEYLMTYGWAILIIAVVLASLYQLGVFNSSNLTQRAQPGSCKVFRPNGPGTTAFINLVGVCNGQLPQFVGSFDGASSYINLGNPTVLQLATSITISAWVKGSTSLSNGAGIYGRSQTSGTSNYIDFRVSNKRPAFILYDGVHNPDAMDASGFLLNDNKWHFMVGVRDYGNKLYIYIDGVEKANGIDTAGTLTNINVVNKIGLAVGGVNYWNGLISNIQIYNTSLSASDIQALYIEGIGGAPISLQYLVGWWPLNANATDYSGNNNNNGVPTSVSYSSSWTSGYTVP